MSTVLAIDYYSDVLCVWAWIAQRRLEELQQQWGQQIELQHHYLNIFGDTAGRIEKQWGDRGGFNGFGQHVIASAQPYDNAPVNPQIWQTIRPATSANAHLILKAVEINESADKAADLAVTLRKKFFVDCMDIGQLGVVLKLASDEGLDPRKLQTTIESGEAVARLMADYQQAQEQGIKGSPSWVLDCGRQTLYGNIGYRVLNANIEELLRQPEREASWC